MTKTDATLVAIMASFVVQPVLAIVAFAARSTRRAAISLAIVATAAIPLILLLPLMLASA